MDNPGRSCHFPALMKPPTPIAVAFREVRHFKPEDCLHCEAIEVRGRLHDWTIPAHRHEGLHQFQLLESGRATVTLDNVPHCVQAPAALMLAPGCVHAFDYAPDCAGHQVTVPTALLQHAFADAPALVDRLALSLVLDADALDDDDAAQAQQLFARLVAEFDGAEPARMEALRALAVLVAAWFLRRAGSAPPDETRRALRDTLVQRFRSLLELHLRRHQPLGFYAASLKVTPDHLSRACRAVTGQSALDLLHERLLQEARRLLAYTDATVAEVAHELGFADAAYFSRFFARRAGLAPQAYRAGLQSGTALRP
jgi:AraC family transcriptional activator of pobA